MKMKESVRSLLIKTRGITQRKGGGGHETLKSHLWDPGFGAARKTRSGSQNQSMASTKIMGKIEKILKNIVLDIHIVIFCH